MCEPSTITREWRLFIVDGKPVAASQYRSNGRLKIESHAPSAVLQFAEQMCDIWTPCDLFVIDICEQDGNYYIVELNAMNCAGFYACDVEAIVQSVAEHFAQRPRK